MSESCNVAGSAVKVGKNLLSEKKPTGHGNTGKKSKASRGPWNKSCDTYNKKVQD